MRPLFVSLSAAFFSLMPALICAQTKPAAPVSSLAALLPDSPGFSNLCLRFRIADKEIVLPCRVFIPMAYDRAKDSWPLAVFLHDDADRGTDLAAIANFPIERWLRQDAGVRQNFRLITVCPQCPPNVSWDDPAMTQALLALIGQLQQNFRIDPERITLAGVGSGAAGAWRAAAEAPELFAAVCGDSTRVADLPRLDPQRVAHQLRHVNTWVIASQNDPETFPAYLKMVESLGIAKSNVQFQRRGNNRPDAIREFLTDGRTYEWMLQQRRRPAKECQDRDQREAQSLRDAIANLPKAPGDYRMSFETWSGDSKHNVPWLLHLPSGYDKSDKRWPLAIFLHGAGEGNLDAAYVWGPAQRWKEDARFRDWYPFIGLHPIHDNSPERAKAIVDLLDDVERKFRVDPDRVYVTGFSLGGTSTWTIAEAGADRFAAIGSICGRSRGIDLAPRLAKLSTWIMVGSADGDFTVGSHQMLDALNKVNADVHISEFPGMGHGPWPLYYADQRFYEWFLLHRRLNDAELAAAATLRKSPDALPTRPGHYFLQTIIPGRAKPITLRYGLYLPKGYDKSTVPVPAMVSFHNENDRNSSLSMIFNWGSDVDPRKSDADREKFPMIGITPQLPPDRQWNDPELTAAVLALLDRLQSPLRIDPDRIYLTGQQSGGVFAWQVACADPTRFAAIVPFQAPPYKPEVVAAALKYVPSRLLAPAGDGGAIGANKQMASFLKRAGAEVRVAVTAAPNDPNGWQPYYTDPDLCNWLLQHKRPTDADRLAQDRRDAARAFAQAPTAPGNYLCRFSTTLNGQPIDLAYRLYLSKNYDKTQDRWPMLLYLHSDQPASRAHAPDLELQHNSKLADAYPLIALCPQCPAGHRWNEPEMVRALVALVDDAARTLRIDADRIYAAGVETGGTGAWQLANEAPDRFAAIAPAAGDIQPAAPLDRIKGLAAWIVSTNAGAADATRQLAENMKKAQSDVQLTLLPAPNELWLQIYGDAKFYEWLFRHRRQQ